MIFHRTEAFPVIHACCFLGTHGFSYLQTRRQKVNRHRPKSAACLDERKRQASSCARLSVFPERDGIRHEVDLLPCLWRPTTKNSPEGLSRLRVFTGYRGS